MYLTERANALAPAAEVSTALGPVIVAVKDPSEEAQVVAVLARPMSFSLNQAIIPWGKGTDEVALTRAT